MPVPASIDELSPTASANYPAGTEQVFPNLDNYLRFYAACIAQLRDRIGAEGLPLASVMWWGGARASIQSRFAPMDGQFLSRATYPALWAMVSAGGYPLVTEAAWVSDPGARASFSVGDGATTFRMPDLNGKQDGIGATTVRGDGSYSAGAAGRIQDGQNLSHAHGASASQNGAHTHTVGGTAAYAGEHSHGSGVLAGGSEYTGHVAAWNHGSGGVNTGIAGGHSHQVNGTASAAGTHMHAITVAVDGGAEARMKSATGAWVMRVN